MPAFDLTIGTPIEPSTRAGEAWAGELRAAARAAFLYALPLTEIALIRGRLLGAGLPAGHFYAQKGLATPADRFVTTPNNDTIYANAFIDLRQGPATLTIPPLGERYASLYLMDMFSNSIAVLGSRTTGQDGGTFTLVGPTDAAPAGALRSPTPWVWAMARVLVNGPEDTSAALSVLHQFGCDGTPAVTKAAARCRPQRAMAGVDECGQRAAAGKPASGHRSEDAA